MTTRPELVVRMSSGHVLPTTLNAREAGKLLRSSAETVRTDCDAGRIPTLPAPAGSQRRRRRIPTIWVLEQLRIDFEIVSKDAVA